MIEEMRVLIPDRGRDFPLLNSVGESVKLTTNIGVVPKLMDGGLTPLPHTSSLTDV
jgi:hypothetical protein